MSNIYIFSVVQYCLTCCLFCSHLFSSLFRSDSDCNIGSCSTYLPLRCVFVSEIVFFVTWEEDMRDADIVNLAVISTRRGVNHAYFVSIWCDASYMLFFCSLFCESGPVLFLSAPFSWMPTPIQLSYLLIIVCSVIKGCLVVQQPHLMKYVSVIFSS